MQATLSLDASAGEKVGVTCKVGGGGEDGQEVLICSLREGATESHSLDLIFDHYTEFRVQGNASVHLTGYYMPEFEEGMPRQSKTSHCYMLQQRVRVTVDITVHLY
jgi:hypothetical protein